MFTPFEILNIAKISLWLALNDISKGTSFGDRLDPNLGRKIYMEYESLQWLYDNEPTSETTAAVANYVYELCGAYSLEANVIRTSGSGGGTVTPVTPVPDNIYPFTRTGAQFEPDGVSYNDARIVGDELMLFVTGFNQEWQFSPTFFDYTSTGFIITWPGFNANDFGNIIIQRLYNN